MKVKIWPRKPNEKGGYACMPLKKNVLDPGKDWKLTTCPECGEECYETPLFRSIRKQQEIKALCTMCALKKGM